MPRAQKQTIAIKESVVDLIERATRVWTAILVGCEFAVAAAHDKYFEQPHLQAVVARHFDGELLRCSGFESRQQSQ